VPHNLEYIVVEGPVGVGKTSLAGRLADAFGMELLRELPEDNPFLERFYRSREQFALPTQLYFLFQRARQLRTLKQGDLFRPGCVSDFLFEKDRLFASVNLADDEMWLYEQIYAQLRMETPAPDLVIYLQAPIEVLIERINKRDNQYEQQVDIDYLQSLVDAYTQFFYHYNDAPLLIVNAADINLVDNSADFDMLLEHINNTHHGRRFLNPLAAS
jgi:deoxyadenosine/deoxycytidine kinase